MHGPARMTPRLYRDLFAGLLVLCAYIIAGKFGLALAFVHPSASPVWPPTGISIAVLLYLGYRFWPAVFLGALFVNWSADHFLVSFAIATGNTLEGLCAAWLVNRFAGGREAFYRARNVFAYAVFAGLLSTAVSASIGVTALALSGSATWAGYPVVWMTWWLGDAGGGLLLAPVLLLWLENPRVEWLYARWAEVGLLLAAVVAVSLFVFGTLGPFGSGHTPTSFLSLPLLMWAAFRFGPRETVTITFIVAAIAIYGTMNDLGPFAGISANTGLLLLQGYMATIATFALAVSAQVAEINAAHRERAERLRLEELARRRAEELNRAKDQFLATISHELRTPLNAMLSWLYVARAMDVDDAMKERALEVIEGNTRHQIRLIEDLLDVSRMLSGKYRLEPMTIDLGAVINSALDTVKLAAENKGIQLECRLDESIFVWGDAVRLQQVVWNLLTNAVKFTPGGGRVEIRLAADGPDAVITVSDTGPGVPEEFVSHLFEPFMQADASITRRHGGLGLGLSIVHQLVQLHGGTVTSVNAGAGQGAIFSVCIPRREGIPEPAPSLPPETPGQSRINRGLDGMGVLLVDDDPGGREALQLALTMAGAKVHTAATVEEAMEALDRVHADFLIADIGMADENGLDLIRKIRALPPQQGGRIPAIAFTAHVLAQDRELVLTAGYQMHIAKPAEPAVLIDAIHGWFRENRAAGSPLA